MKAIVAVASLFVVSQAFLFGGGPEWNSLRVTWGINPFSDFTEMPRTVKDAESQGWELRDNACANNNAFVGQRYWLKQDPAVTLLFDTQGTIAGIQTSAAKTEYTPSEAMMAHPFMEDGDFYTLTAYFVDPSTVCTEGRPNSDLDTKGTGDRLVLQNGQDPTSDYKNIPMTQDEDALAQQKWTKGFCFDTMGLHYWYDVTKDMSCKNFFPAFLLYNSQKLNAFGFAINAGLTSTRYEHPTAQVAKMFINPEPQCFFDDPSFAKLSTMHIYMTNSPITNFC